MTWLLLGLPAMEFTSRIATKSPWPSAPWAISRSEQSAALARMTWLDGSMVKLIMDGDEWLHDSELNDYRFKWLDEWFDDGDGDEWLTIHGDYDNYSDEWLHYHYSMVIVVMI